MTLLIKNVKLLGSDLEPEARADVFVSGETISAIGDFSRKGADEVIDGQGGYLTPGFIDFDTTSDHYLSLFDNPGQEDFLKQGVTTIVGGHCGASLAPLLYGSLESLIKWADVNKINVDWHTFGEFMDKLRKRPLGVNFATFAGHSTIRQAIVGDDARDLTKNETGVFLSVVERAMAEGALGLSTGLEYVHARGTPYQELLALAQAVQKANAIYSTHLRSTGAGIAGAMQEAIKLAAESGASTFVSHFMPFVGSRKEYEDAAELVDKLPATADFHVGMHPFGGSMIPFYRLLPHWAQTGTMEMMANSLRDEWLAKRVAKDLPEVRPEDLTVAEVPGQNILTGETLASFMEHYEIKEPQQALLRLLTMTKLQGVAYIQNVDQEAAGRMLAHPRTVIASHAPALAKRPHEKHFKSPRATSTFPEFLRRAVADNLLPLPEAVRKITAVPAEKMKLAKRGWIREGYMADLAVFRNFEVKATVVNGAVAVRDGAATGAQSGRPLAHRPS